MATIYEGGGITFTHNLDTSPKTRRFVLHVHDYYEILCLVSGNVSYLVEGREYAMSSGCVMLTRPAESHVLRVNGDEPYDRYVIGFRAENITSYGFSEDMLSAFTKRGLGERNRYTSDALCGVEAIGLFRQAEAACEALTDKREAVSAVLVTLLCALNTAFVTGEHHQRDGDADEVGKKLIEYVNSHLTEELTLASVSEYAHMSPSQTGRIFRKMTGASFYDYVLSKRLVLVRELISRGEGAVSASQRCGFGDYSSFYRLYKKRTGESPSSAKRNGRGE